MRFAHLKTHHPSGAFGSAARRVRAMIFISQRLLRTSRRLPAASGVHRPERQQRAVCRRQLLVSSCVKRSLVAV
jgi:hypothetical protein